jgi:hypothetical protein
MTLFALALWLLCALCVALALYLEHRHDREELAMLSRADEAVSLARVCAVYRLVYAAKVVSCDRYSESLELCEGAAQAAGELAQHYAERALWLASVEGRA